jgi:hypothetical protein
VKPPEGPADAALGLDLEAANSHELDDPWGLRVTEEVEKAMQPEAIRVDLATVPSRVPLVGWLITRFKEILFHVVPWSYVPVCRTAGTINRWRMASRHRSAKSVSASANSGARHSGCIRAVDRLNNSSRRMSGWQWS